MEKRQFLYEGKAKQIFLTDVEDQIIIHYKDDATAFNGVKKANINSKGILNNKITEIIFNLLEKNGVKTHFIKRLDDRNQLCKRVEIIPLEVIVRNVIAGSMAKRLDMEEGSIPENTIYELCLKNDDLGDPLINDHHAVALGCATYEELEVIYSMTKTINDVLTDLFKRQGIRLVDFKIEFGKTMDGDIVLADEISPDTCRLWDLATNKKLDKDRFRRDLGDVVEAYVEIFERLSE
jgi:phosphoribosylaminoimidazole-succinocarboxamide synthase